MEHFITNLNKKGVSLGALLLGMALLSACGKLAQPTPLPPSGDGYLLTVAVSANDSQESISQKYGGSVIAWLGDKAILKLSNQAAAALQASGISLQSTTLDPNSSTAAPEVSAQGFSAWAGGFSAWAGGWSAWAGGWSAWAGATNNLPSLPSQNRGESLQVKLPQGQALSRNFGSGIKVAVIDTGIDTTHPMFGGRLAPNTEWKDFVDGDTNPQEDIGIAYGHGTAAAGIILQAAPKALILPIRVLAGDGSGDVANVVSAIDWAIQKGANVINLSLGTTTAVAALQTIINSATAQGIYVVASAGNTGDGNITYPAAWAKSGIGAKYLLSVGSVNSSNGKSSFSCSGTALEFLAPGEAITSAYPGGQIANFTGTSFAAPQVAGAVALALADTAAANRGNMESYLLNSNTLVGSYGLINVAGFLQQLPDFVRRQALLVVGSTKLVTNDSLLKSKLEGLGYTVNLQDDDTSATGNASGMDVVVLAPSVDDKKVTTKFSNVAVPVVVMYRFLYDDMGMVASGAYQSAASQTQVAIGNSTHPLAAGYLGSVAVYSASTSLQWGTPSSSAVSVANVVGNTSRATIFGYNTGDLMVGMAAPARRVGFFLWGDGASKWSSIGSNLFEAAVTWAVSGN